MKTNALATVALLMLGCAHDPDTLEVQQGVDGDLQRLRALQVFEVGDLIATEPAGDAICYVCPDVPDLAEQGDRLRGLADVAEAAARAPVSCDVSIEDELGALRALQIVEIGDLLLEEPQPDPSCYNQLCGDEVARVEAVNCAQVGRLAAIAAAAAGL